MAVAVYKAGLRGWNSGANNCEAFKLVPKWSKSLASANVAGAKNMNLAQAADLRPQIMNLPVAAKNA